MKILIYGAGAMGLYFAATLAEQNHTVYLKTRTLWHESNQVTVRKAGTHENIVEITQVFDQMPDELDIDLVIIATKAWQVKDAVQDIKGKIPPRTAILTFQNGISAPEHVAENLTENPVVASTCVVIVKREKPGVVSLLGHEAKLVAGNFTVDRGARGVLTVCEIFKETPVQVQETEDIHRALWKKLSLIASYGGVGACSNLTVGKTRSHSSTREMVYEAIRECASVAHAHHIVFTDQDIEDTFSIYTHGFNDDTTSSMQRDLAEGKPSELDDQVGEIVRRARSHDVSVPIHSFLYRVLKPREEIARSGV